MPSQLVSQRRIVSSCSVSSTLWISLYIRIFISSDTTPTCKHITIFHTHPSITLICVGNRVNPDFNMNMSGRRKPCVAAGGNFSQSRNSCKNAQKIKIMVLVVGILDEDSVTNSRSLLLQNTTFIHWFLKHDIERKHLRHKIGTSCCQMIIWIPWQRVGKKTLLYFQISHLKILDSQPSSSFTISLHKVHKHIVFIIQDKQCMVTSQLGPIRIWMVSLCCLWNPIKFLTKIIDLHRSGESDSSLSVTVQFQTTWMLDH